MRRSTVYVNQCYLLETAVKSTYCTLKRDHMDVPKQEYSLAEPILTLIISNFSYQFIRQI